VSDVTRILQSLDSGDPKAAEELLPLVYDQLRRLAASLLSREAPGQTLQPTALVHEAWLRLVDDNQTISWKSRGHFFGAAAEAMRRILVDSARRKNAAKRGANPVRLELEDFDLISQSADEWLLALNDALTRLESLEPEKAKVVTMRFFGGLTNQQIALTLGVNERTVDRYWSYAKIWLFREVKSNLD